VIETLSGLPYAYNTDGVVAIVDANNVSLTYENAPASFQLTVVVEP
jgi:hypothetical protein